MEIQVRKDTFSLIQDFRIAHSSCIWECGKSNAAALKGIVTLVNAYLAMERDGNTLMINEGRLRNADKLDRARIVDTESGARYVPFTMKEQFEIVSRKLQTSQSEIIRLSGNLKLGNLAHLHAYMKHEGLLSQDSTQGQALDIAARAVTALSDRPGGWIASDVAVKNKKGNIAEYTVVLI